MGARREPEPSRSLDNFLSLYHYWKQIDKSCLPFRVNTIKLTNGIFKYDPAKPLGKRGGFGQVFAGLTAEGVEVAVKKLHVSAADAAHRELKIAEEFKGRTFQHVIQFIDSGVDADTGDYFVIMPRAKHSLQAAIESSGPFSTNDTASILLQIVLGLIEADDIVHRDLKPDNVLFHDAKWKVADFGIARFTEEATSSNTLKDCLSPHYAAPEQWRFERSTHATDVYALGCVAFCLLTGNPPFTTNPVEEHQRAPVPSFPCDDPRISSLVNMMLRKLPPTRPELNRVKNLLSDITATPHQTKAASAHSALASAGAQVAESEQRIQAEQEAARAVRRARKELATGALQILEDNAERLWGKIHGEAPAANRASGSILKCELGDGALAINYVQDHEQDAFQRCRWDVISAGEVAVIQRGHRAYIWSSSLWYAKPKNSSDYRWYEISFRSLNYDRYQPFACSNWDDADLALAPIMHVVDTAFGPVIIDDEKEDEFHARWMWLLGKASIGKLSQPSTLPISQWPPNLVYG